jgi:hypothetical protein
MSKIIGVLLTSVIILGASVPALAGSKTPRINKREHRQKHRIAQGIRSGELSARETARLVAHQARIRAWEARAKSDGKVTAYERARLHHELNQANRRIRRQKHD